MGRQEVAPLQQDHDMEVTDERLSYMKKLLLRLYADQIGMEIASVEVRPAAKEEGCQKDVGTQ